MKYLCDICKGLSAVHKSTVHCSIKPSSIFINENGDAMLGEISKVELDAARHTH